MTRTEVLKQAIKQCMQELYSKAQPSITWEAFLEENKAYSAKFKQWEDFHKAYLNKEKYPATWEAQKAQHPEWENCSKGESIGPAPYEFYYISRDMMKAIADSYIEAYGLNDQENLLNIIDILKDYCKEPIISKYIKDRTDENGIVHPGYRGYDHPDNLQTELSELVNSKLTEKVIEKFFKFLDMAGNFYKWDYYVNSFNTSIYLGASPNSNKEAVINNWKKYRNTDIEIDETKYNDDDDY